MVAGEYGRTRKTCFVACRHEVVAIAGLLCISWCVWGAADFFVFFFLDFFFRTHTAWCMHEAASCLIYLSTSTGVRAGCHFFIILSVCPSVCVSQCV